MIGSYLRSKPGKLLATFLVIVALVALLTGVQVAAAADAPSSGAAEVVSNAGGFVSALLAALAPVALDLASIIGLAVLAWAGGFIRNLAAKTKQEAFRAALQTLNEIAITKVTEIYQQAISDLKAASEDGRLTPDEIIAARQTAVNEILEGLPQWLLAVLRSAIGGGVQDVIDKYISPAVEKAVTQTPTEIRINTEANPEVLRERAAMARARIGLALPSV